MMRLAELVAGLPGARVVGDGSVGVAELAYDSRKVEPGTLFFCVVGEKVDGHEFGARAVEDGAVALVVERELTDLDVARWWSGIRGRLWLRWRLGSMAIRRPSCGW